MRCDFEQLEPGLVRCRKCGRKISSKHPPRKVVAVCPSGKPTTGPGSQLRELLQELGVGEFPGCDCPARIAQMNEWGVAGCRENFETIRGWLVEAQGSAGWLTLIFAGSKAIATGLAGDLELNDLAGSLLRLAIRRAERG